MHQNYLHSKPPFWTKLSCCKTPFATDTSHEKATCCCFQTNTTKRATNLWFWTLLNGHGNSKMQWTAVSQWWWWSRVFDESSKISAKQHWVSRNPVRSRFTLDLFPMFSSHRLNVAALLSFAHTVQPDTMAGRLINTFLKLDSSS